MKHCSGCKHHTFKLLDNYCRLHERVISREKWNKVKDDGSNVCCCGEWVDKELKSVRVEGPK